MRRRETLLLLAAGVGLVVGTRLAIPSAPALYDGIYTQPPPYRWASPPPDLASSNKPPLGGEGDVPVAAGTSKAASVKTDDGQALAFFAEGNLLAGGANSIHVKIAALPDPPPPPPGTKYIGNVYSIEGAAAASGSASPPAIRFKAPGQFLFRIPPVSFGSIEVQAYYDHAWHKTVWSAQSDSATTNIEHFGLFAADDPGFASPKPHPAPSGFNPVYLIEFGLTVLALAVIVGAVVVQRRRTAAIRAEAENAPRGRGKGGGKRR